MPKTNERGAFPIDDLRDVSRKLVRELGFMSPTLGDTGLSPSAVHAVIEIGRAPGIQARDLASLLRLDKSNMSRQLAKLEASGLLQRESSSDDARTYFLYLSNSGRALLRRIDRDVTGQVMLALGKLEAYDRQELVRCLKLYVDALQDANAARATKGDTK